MRAMRDELARNVRDLAIEGYPRPFLTNFLLLRGRSINVEASMGAVVRVESAPVSMPFVRQVVGDYHFDSEEAGIFQNVHVGSFPQESDYDEVRRYFWEASDAAYRHAIGSYARRLSRLRQRNLDVRTLPDDMAQAAASVTFVPYPLPDKSFDEERCRQYVGAAAAYLDTCGPLLQSGIRLYGVQAELMMTGSEGTEYAVPYNFLQMTVQASVCGANGSLVSDEMAIHVPLFGDLPSEESLRTRLAAFVDTLAAAAQLPVLEDDYFGPILLEGEAVASLVDKFMVLPLVNNKNPLGGGGRTSEQKFGKRIAAPGVDILSLPHLATYGGERLWGAFEVDIDGLRPADSLMLVCDGMLCGLLASRVSTRRMPVSNGYGHIVFTPQGFGQMPAPGVLEISVRQHYVQDNSHAALLEQARREGLEYAYIVRSFVDNGKDGRLKVPELYRIYVADGRMERCFPATLVLENTVARRIVSAAAAKKGYNRTNNGILCSYICPESLLLSEAEILPLEPSRMHPLAVSAPAGEP